MAKWQRQAQLNKAAEQFEKPSAILSFIQKEKLTVDALIRKYGGIKRAALVAVFKAIYRADLEILIYTDPSGLEGGIAIRSRTEHDIEMFHVLDTREYICVQSVFAIRDELADLIDGFSVEEEAKSLLHDAEMNRRFDSRAAVAELAAWKHRLSDILVTVSRIVSNYRTHGLTPTSYAVGQEDFLLQDMLNIAYAEGLIGETEEDVNEGFADIDEPAPIFDEPRPTAYMLSNGISLEVEFLAEAAKLYASLCEEQAVRGRLTSGEFDDLIFGRVPQRELERIMECIHAVRHDQHGISEHDATTHGIMMWHKNAYSRALNSFYKAYQDEQGSFAVSKEEFEAGSSEMEIDIFHSRAMAARYLGQEDYWLWRLVVKEQPSPNQAAQQPDSAISTQADQPPGTILGGQRV